jgi:2-succinyl-6-hydroxy-2,4-cyclohexadiene-1-carboxylate synthase
MPLLRVQDVDYHYQQRGQGSPLVLLHGFTGRVENWAHLLPVLAQQYETVAIDLLGHGRTTAPANPDRYAMPRAAADLATLFQDLDLPTVKLWGYSMGGRLALYLAVHYPELVHSLVLESASPGLKTEAGRAARREKDTDLARRIEREGIAAFVDFWEQVPLFASQQSLPETVRRRHRALRLQNRPEGLANSLCGMGTGAQPSLWPRLPDMRLPVRLVAGELDMKFVQIGQEMAAQLPQATLHVVPGAGHTVHLERPEAMLSIAQMPGT